MVNRAGVAREWQHYWDGLISCIPLWENQSDVIEDIFNGPNNSSQNEPFIWKDSSFGPAIDTIGGSSGHRARWTSGWNNQTVLEGSTEITFAVLVNIANIASGESPLTYFYDRTAETPWFQFVEVGADFMTAEVRISGTTRAVTVGIDTTGLGWTLYTCTWQSGDFVRFNAWPIGGEKLPEETSTSAHVGSLDVPTDPEFMFLSGHNLQRGFTGEYGLFYAWNRKLSDEDLIRLGVDPFGPIRPDPLPITLIDLAGEEAPGPLPYRTIQNRRRTTVRM